MPDGKFERFLDNKLKFSLRSFRRSFLQRTVPSSTPTMVLVETLLGKGWAEGPFLGLDFSLESTVTEVTPCGQETHAPQASRV